MYQWFRYADKCRFRGKERQMTLSRQRISDKRLLTIAELAQMIGLSPQTIRNKMSKKAFPIKHKRLGRLVRFEKRDVERYLNSLPDSY